METFRKGAMSVTMLEGADDLELLNALERIVREMENTVNS